MWGALDYRIESVELAGDMIYADYLLPRRRCSGERGRI